MRVLFVTPYLPSLIRVRPLNFLRQLSLHHEVTLVSLVHGDPSEAESIERVREYCEKVYVLPLSRTGSFLSCCRRLLTPMPLQAAYTYMPAASDFLAEVAESQPYDVLHVEHIRGAHMAEKVRSIPRVFDSVDCITRLLKQRLKREGGIVQRILGYEELIKMRSYEARIASEFDGVVITSEQDKRALERLIRRFARKTDPEDPLKQRRGIRQLAEELQDARLGIADITNSERVSVVRNGVDSDYFQSWDVRDEPTTIAFSGKMSYFPNSLAVIRFYHQVFPLIRRVRPDARFRIVGSAPPDSVRKLAADPAVEVTGFVPDIRPHIVSARVVVCPLSIGVGIQNKVLEAMSLGKPVVASSLACKGIPGAVSGSHLMRADDPEKMAEAILWLMASPESARAMGRQARLLICDSYSWEAATKALEEVYEKTVEARGYRLSCAA